MKLYVYIFLGLLGLLAGSFLMHVLAKDPGLILISLGDTSIEMSFWYGVILLLGSLTSLVLTWKSIKIVWGWLAGSVSWIQESREKKAERRTSEGLIHFVEGNWQAAKKNLLSAAKDSANPLVHYLAAAKSAHAMGSREESMFLLEQASKVAPKNDLSIGLSRARLQLEDKAYQECLTTLKGIAAADQKNAAVLDLKYQSYIGLHDWAVVVELLPLLKSSALLSTEAYQKLEENIYLSLLDSALGENEASHAKLTGVWESLPKKIRKTPKLVGLYCTCLHRLGEDDAAFSLLKKALKSQWHIGLVELYGNLQTQDTKAQLSLAEQWLSEHSDDAHLLFALGKLSAKNSLWGKAKDYFNASLKIQERPEVYAELAELMAELGENEKSASLYKKGLLLKTAIA